MKEQSKIIAELEVALSKLQKRSPQEQRKVEQELKEYENKHGLDALNKKLFKDAGLE